ncbi:unnamed protein product [Peniophora sp. CBMAI 1063]|nr:unnamed protein product [Peniophora sp. CBMAI 1063]
MAPVTNNKRSRSPSPEPVPRRIIKHWRCESDSGAPEAGPSWRPRGLSTTSIAASDEEHDPPTTDTRPASPVLQQREPGIAVAATDPALPETSKQDTTSLVQQLSQLQTKNGTGSVLETLNDDQVGEDAEKLDRSRSATPVPDEHGQMTPRAHPQQLPVSFPSSSELPPALKRRVEPKKPRQKMLGTAIPRRSTASPQSDSLRSPPSSQPDSAPFDNNPDEPDAYPSSSQESVESTKTTSSELERANVDFNGDRETSSDDDSQ